MRLAVQALFLAATLPGSGTPSASLDCEAGELLSWSGTAWECASASGAPDADAATKGVVQLADDLGGTAASPDVVDVTCSGSCISDSEVDNGITVDLAATATALAANPAACSAGQFVSDIAADGTLTCAAPVQARLTSPVAVAVSASYVTVFTFVPPASKVGRLSFKVMHAASATTVGVQFRVLSADVTGNCFFAAHGIAGTAASATAEEYDVIAIGSNPADNASAAAGFTALNIVDIDCAVTTDSSPQAIVLEAQLETGTTSINILEGTSYQLVAN